MYCLILIYTVCISLLFCLQTTWIRSTFSPEKKIYTFSCQSVCRKKRVCYNWRGLSCKSKYHFEKRREWRFWAFSTFPILYFMSQTCPKVCWNWQEGVLTLPHNPSFQRPWNRWLLKTLWEKEKMLEKPAFSPFPTMFSTLPKPNFNFSFTFILLSANALNLD